jgi:uncharacterized protein YbjT (DUF2867 family)
VNAVLVTGAGGTLGRRLVGELARRGFAVAAATTREGAPKNLATIRYVRVDLTTGAGLDDAVGGVSTIVHSASSPPRAREVDRDGLLRLVKAAPQAHVIYPGIVGCDLIPTPYYRIKTETEQALIESGAPWTILRATQFHQLIWHWYATESRNPFLLVPRDTRYQVVDPLEVARRLVDLVESGPQGRVDDIGGPTAYEAADLARSSLAAVGSKRRIIKYNKPGIIGAALRAGANLTPHRAAGQTWNEFVQRQMEQRPREH